MGKNQEKIEAALARIDEGMENINTDKDWMEFLTFQSRFYSYSFRNTMLIYRQKPGATFVKGFNAWNQLGRYVKKGAKGIAILAPCIKKVEVFKEPENRAEYHEKEGEKEMRKVITGFRIAYVFDISDTDGSDGCLPVLVKGLSGDGEHVKEIYGKLKEFISTEHEVLEVEGTASKGSYNLETGVICVRSDVGHLQKIKTLIHEYAHSIDFAMHPEEDISRNKRELIAESTAFVVCERLGLDTSSYSMSYIKSWLKDKEELKAVAGSVQKVAARIIDSLAESGDSAFSYLKEEQ